MGRLPYRNHREAKCERQNLIGNNDAEIRRRGGVICALQLILKRRFEEPRNAVDVEFLISLVSVPVYL